MATATAERGETACKPEDVNWRPPIGRRPVSELAEVVPAPALGAAGARHCTCVEFARGKPDNARRQAGDVDRSVAIGRRPIAELAHLVFAPALEPAPGRERARVVAAGGNRGNAASEA
jgi:hypothetical protein